MEEQDEVIEMLEKLKERKRRCSLSPTILLGDLSEERTCIINGISQSLLWSMRSSIHHCEELEPVSVTAKRETVDIISSVTDKRGMTIQLRTSLQ